MTEISSEELVKMFEAVAQDIERDPSDFILSQSLYDLLEAVEGKLAGLSQLEPKLFGLIYSFKVFFWDNLFEDFTTKPIPRGRGEHLFRGMVESLGQLIDEVLAGDGKIMDLVGRIVQPYFELAEICEDGDPKDKMYL